MTAPATPAAPVIGEIFRIPRAVHQGDFVLRLTEGVDDAHAAATLRDYVVTPQLVDCFGSALELIRGAMESGASRAAYLHGSFGSGKSHFMAVLSLLLGGNTAARALAELAPVVRDHGGWLGQQKVLVVPMHLISAHSFEAAVFGQYVRHVREHHPEAPLPGVYRADRVFADARKLRASMGDAAFFAELGKGAADEGGWGALGARWDAASFDAATAAPPGDAERSRLVGDLVDHFFSSARSEAAAGGEGYVAVDEGLSIIAQHAQALGYGAVVLFLDEVMLWLASRAGDTEFLAREAQKLIALVETANMQRPIPIVSFLARQRDLRDLIGEHVVGAEQQAINDVLRFWAGRFATIQLEDRNLPAIIEKRLLRPVDEAARARLEEAHVQTEKIRQDVMQVLLTREGDRQQFRQVYPFSPVLVQALVALSSLLQRERTALKLLVQLLVNQRETLALGDVMPVGELWSVLADGTEQPFSATARERFEQARRLWKQRLVPLLEREKADAISRGTPPEQAERDFRTDARLLATLILSALAEGVEALSGLSAQKLAALNHGTVRTRIAGQEARLVLERLRRWAGEVGEITLEEQGTTNRVSLHLAGVDTDLIIENARAADSLGARVQKVRQLVFEAAGISAEGTLTLPIRSVLWRGTERKVEVLFANVRGMAPETFRPTGEATWRLVIDYPFDEPGQSPINDRAAINQARSNGIDAQALVWLPHFLTPSAQDDLGKLVVLDFLLTGTQLDAHAAHLSASERAQAGELLKGQASALRTSVLNALLSAYGITEQFRDRIDDSHALETNFYSLSDTLTLQRPVGATMAEALEHLVGQALAWQFPAHPQFTREVKPGSLRKVWGWVQKAAQQPNGRIEIDAPDRDEMKRLAVPLELGDMGDAPFVLTRRWETHFAQCHAQDGVTPVTVERVRKWIDQPKARGLTREAANLVILTWALQTNRSFHLVAGGAAVDATIDRLHDDFEVRRQQLPDEATWSTATRRAAELLGLVAPPLRSAQGVAILGRAIAEKVTAVQAGVTAYAQELETALGRVQVTDGNRRESARSAREIVSALQGASATKAIEVLASAAVPTSGTAVGEAIEQGAELAAQLRKLQWSFLPSLAQLPREHFGARVDALVGEVREALRADEYVTPLADVVGRFNDESSRLLAESAAIVQQLAAARAEAEAAARREREEAERRAREQREAAMQADRERLAAAQAQFERERAEFERQRQAQQAAQQPSIHKKPGIGVAPKSRRVTRATLDTVLAELRHDVEAAGTGEIEVTWRTPEGGAS